MKLPDIIWRVILPLAAVLVLALCYLAIFASSTATVYRAKAEASKNPVLSLMPVSLPDTSISPEKGKAEAFFGFEFEIPWKDSEVKQGNAAALIISPSRREAMTFFNPATAHGLVAMMKDAPGLRPELVYSLYGTENTQSDFDLTRAALNTSPKELSLVMPWNKEVHAANLLRMKKSYIGIQTGRVYSFEINTLKGFQRGDLENTQVVVDAFDAQNHEFTFIFSGMPGPNSGFKQADVNRVLQTFKASEDNDDD